MIVSGTIRTQTQFAKKIKCRLRHFFAVFKETLIK